MHTETEKDRPVVLVVDDSPENIAVLNELLRERYLVKVATNGEKALQIIFGEESIDLVLLDVQMPGIDGYEVCRRIKADPEKSSIPVIFVTAKDEVAEEFRGFQVGAADYIQKPIQPEIVLARVEAHLALRSALLEEQRRNEVLEENIRLREQVEAMTRHDLKSPLAVVINFPSLLQEDENLTDRQRRYLKHIDNAGQRMLEIVNRTIDLHRLETGSFVPVKKEFNLLQIIEQLQSQMSVFTQEKNIEWDIRLMEKEIKPEDSFCIESDEYLIFSIMQNLIKNACEASPPGETVSIHLAGDREFAIRISNAGAVPEIIRDRFFEKYATSGKESGTGLGAYSARLMSEALGGSLEYDGSRKGRTTIILRL